MQFNIKSKILLGIKLDRNGSNHLDVLWIAVPFERKLFQYFLIATRALMVRHINKVRNDHSSESGS